ncbi:transcriptional regulator NanR [Salipiger mucosus]|uniref:Transcriptional regulator NanR n=1 Tax=Salipiger mucosus DSM 16094 TaxID=1123237 RepID=S9QIW5_9RHOB|nr:transcriptional regulator NanR [Salipiger mucosus]EPX79508.1 transcriptional regulator NanR [Salipiger mucosus DSM 16094]
MTPSDPIRPRKLSDEVHARLLALIREGRLAPGDALPSERELMARFEVGRPVVREAMQRLAQAGLVEIRHGGRPRVAEPSLDVLVDQLGLSMQHLLTHSAATLDHLKEARLALERELARIAARRRTKEDMTALRAVLDAQEDARETPERFLDLDGQFHRTIAAISRNPLFESLCHGIFSWLRDFHVDFVRSPGQEALTLAEHEAILEAIGRGDADAAAQAMHDHLERAKRLYAPENLASS